MNDKKKLLKRCFGIAVCEYNAFLRQKLYISNIFK